MLTSLCPFKVPVPIDSDESLLSTSIDQSSIHTIPTVFDYDVSSLFSYALVIEYNDKNIPVSSLEGKNKRIILMNETAGGKTFQKYIGDIGSITENDTEI